MNPSEFEHPPLGRVVEGLASTDGLTTAEIKASLQEQGCDADALALRLKARVRALSHESRLGGWMQQGEAVQAKLESALRGRRSWLERRADEINAAFNEVVAGSYGSQGQLKVQSAFSNLKEVTLESKAQFLDEVEVLLSLQAPPSDPPASS